MKTNVIRVAQDFTSDTLTPVLAFLRLARGGRKAFLFESVEGGERLGRYSFLGIEPREMLMIRDGKAEVTRGAERRALPGNPFRAIGDYLSRYHAEPNPGLPPFQGGAIGYVGYECASFLEAIPVPQARKEDASIPQAAVMVFKNIVAFDHVRRRVYVIANIFTDEESAAQGRRRALKEVAALKKKIFSKSPDERPLFFPKTENTAALAPAKAVMSRTRFVGAVKKIKEHIRAGDIFQCVLSNQFSLEIKAKPFSVYRALQVVNPSPYLFYLSFGQYALFGASPEMLTRVSRGGRTETCPIAGTRPRGRDDVEDRKLERDLLKSVKEKAEHLMLVDLGRNDLGRVSAPGTVNVQQFMQVQRFSHVMHLVSLVEGKLKRGMRSWDALASCFPAGTLSGAPKVRAMEIIAALEPVRRNAYGGAVIYYDFSGHLDSCITIRSLFVRGNQGIAQAGAGVVADSNPVAEYHEVLHKLKAMRRAVAMANAEARLHHKRGRP